MTKKMIEKFLASNFSFKMDGQGYDFTEPLGDSGKSFFVSSFPSPKDKPIPLVQCSEEEVFLISETLSRRHIGPYAIRFFLVFYKRNTGTIKGKETRFYALNTDYYHCGSYYASYHDEKKIVEVRLKTDVYNIKVVEIDVEIDFDKKYKEG